MLEAVGSTQPTMKPSLPSQATFRPLPRASRHLLKLLPLLLLTASRAAQERQPSDTTPRGERKPADGIPRGERKPADGAPRGERVPNAGAPRGERPAGAERIPGPGGRRSEFPAELKLTDEQQAKLQEINTTIATRQADLSKKRDGVLTDEQRTAQAAAMNQLREGNLSRQEAADLLAAAVKLTPAQKTLIEATEAEARQLREESTTQKMAVLTDEQRGILRKLTIAGNVARTFSLPGNLTLTEEQKTGLKALSGELGTKLADLNEQHALLLTDARRLARESAYKDARESGKDRQATAVAVDAALGLTAAEKAQLTEVEQSLRELQQQIRERMIALLTPEQKAELEKRFGDGRRRE